MFLRLLSLKQYFVPYFVFLDVRVLNIGRATIKKNIFNTQAALAIFADFLPVVSFICLLLGTYLPQLTKETYLLFYLF